MRRKREYTIRRCFVSGTIQVERNCTLSFACDHVVAVVIVVQVILYGFMKRVISTTQISRHQLYQPLFAHSIANLPGSQATNIEIERAMPLSSRGWLVPDPVEIAVYKWSSVLLWPS